MAYFKEKKEIRKIRFYEDNYGYKLRKCSACNGSGYYDNTGSPKCWNCNGTGKERYREMLAVILRGNEKPVNIYEFKKDKETGLEYTIISYGNSKKFKKRIKYENERAYIYLNKNVYLDKMIKF